MAYYVGKLFSNFKGFYNEINSATLTGALDVLIIEQEDGSFQSSPFHVRFGKLGVMRSKEKVVDIAVNGEEVDLHMKLGEAGEAFFVQETDEPRESLAELATSPLPSAADLMAQGLREMKENELKMKMRTQSTHSVQSLDSLRTTSDQSLEIHSHGSAPDSRQLGDSPSKSTGNADVKFSLTVEDESESNKKRVRRNTNTSSKDEHVTLKPKQDDDGGSIPEFHDHEGIFEMDPASGDEEILQLTSMGRTVSLPLIEDSRMQMTEEWANSQLASQCYPFSDGDLTPIVSPISSRPPSPYSDTEASTARRPSVVKLDNEEELDWSWGELPHKPAPITPTNEGKREVTSGDSKEDDKTKPGLFQFMRSTKKVRHKPEQEGIYLDDLKLDEMDPEVAALYFPKSFSSQHHVHPIREEDNESGKGASLPQSPNSHLMMAHDDLDITMSLCGGLKEAEGNIQMERFLQALVTFDDLCENPNILMNPDLVLKMSDKFYNWQIAGPIIMSQLVFHRELPESIVDKLVKEHMPKKERKRAGGMSSWFSWGSKAAVNTEDVEKGEAKKADSTKSGGSSPKSSPPNSAPGSPEKHSRSRSTSRTRDYSTSSDETEPAERSRTRRRASSPKSKEAKKGLFKKSTRLTSEQIARLHLKPGQNKITYSVTTQYQGTTRCMSHIYLWKHDDRIVISDIDGTITRSDVLGQVLPLVGKDWSQSGVAKLYNKIKNNGYKFIYLSARAIGQSKMTRDFLRSIKQGELSLPEGPVLLSPSSLINAFHKEVIERKPEEFKISCLRDIATLFPSSARCPFHAGFGNKINDMWAYRAVGIPISRIFTINHKGHVRNELSKNFQTSYNSLSDIVDHFFTPLQVSPSGTKKFGGNFHAPDQYSTFTFWKEPVSEVNENEISEFLKAATKG